MSNYVFEHIWAIRHNFTESLAQLIDILHSLEANRIRNQRRRGNEWERMDSQFIARDSAMLDLSSAVDDTFHASLNLSFECTSIGMQLDCFYNFTVLKYSRASWSERGIIACQRLSERLHRARIAVIMPGINIGHLTPTRKVDTYGVRLCAIISTVFFQIPFVGNRVDSHWFHKFNLHHCKNARVVVATIPSTMEKNTKLMRNVGCELWLSIGGRFHFQIFAVFDHFTCYMYRNWISISNFLLVVIVVDPPPLRTMIQIQIYMHSVSRAHE